MPGSKVPLFPYNRGWENQPNSRGLYTHYKDSYKRWDDHPQYKEVRPWHIYRGLSFEHDLNVNLIQVSWVIGTFEISRTQEVQADQTAWPLVGSGILATHGSSLQDQPLCLGETGLPGFLRYSRWWFQICFIFTPILWEMIQFD